MILDELFNILDEFSPSADERRRTTDLNVKGISIPAILADLLRKLPWIRQLYPDLSARTIRHLFLPPRKNTNSAKKYLCLIPARVGKVKNNLRKENPLVLSSF